MVLLTGYQVVDLYPGASYQYQVKAYLQGATEPTAISQWTSPYSTGTNNVYRRRLTGDLLTANSQILQWNADFANPQTNNYVALTQQLCSSVSTVIFYCATNIRKRFTNNKQVNYFICHPSIFSALYQ
ncbi:hypothetical protein Ciccas_009274 [Cichlidogyrus casuarinus]|uniref:Fibronectin type-III domain-containing protein n=1 Tax=Cichlidogyrus casuarinus TaxID=1844966 RepID=A0ABD2PXQ5_9PLAT